MRTILFSFIFLFTGLILNAQTPILKVDLNYAERQESEVNEPDYTPWPITGTRTKTFEGVTFEFINGGSAGSWYKAGVQSPNYARLVSDGIKTDDVEMRITGLQRGTHSLVTFHNSFDNPENVIFSPLDIYFNGELLYDNLELTNRVTSNEDATTAYYKFDVEDNDTVLIRFKSDPPDDTYSDDITICGFHLNSSDPKKMAKSPYPEDKDEHVNIDNDTLVFCWQLPEDAVSCNVYFGTNESDVLLADVNSSEFIGTLTDTFFTRTGFYSMDSNYWRVDPIDTDGDTTKGDVWYFQKRVHAFPGAEGYGGYANGGRGGKVVYVTNLEDYDPDEESPVLGSFRYAVKNDSVPRTILFNVSGLITLKARLTISDDYITVAGQTAPGKGICFRWAPVGVTGENNIVQNLRVRLGIGITFDGMGLTGSQYSIIDHCSISWTIDEAFSSRSAENITLQRTLISEPLNAAGHSNYSYGAEHGYAGSIGGDIGSFHHNLLAHCNGRNWSMAGGLDGDSYYAGRLDLFNNVVYNWGSRATDGGAHEVNFVNNYYKKGEATSQNTILKAQLEGTGNGTQSYYTEGNIVENTDGTFACDGTDNSCSRTYKLSNGQVLDWDVFVDEPFFDSEAEIHGVTDAYKIVLSDVGCTQPVFDDHDIRMVNETLNGTYSCSGSYTGKPGLPDHELDVGGWEVYPGYTRNTSWDTDLDGLPDWWENTRGLDTNSGEGDFSDSNADEDKNGYTNLEEYLQWMSQPHYFVEPGENVDINLRDYTKGFTDSPQFTVSDVENGTATINEGDSIVNFTPENEGLAGFSFTVTDAEGSTMSRQVGIFSGEVASDSMFTYSYYLDRDSTNLVTVDSVNTITEVVSSVVDSYFTIQDVNIYPNPANDYLFINFEVKENNPVQLTVFGITGQALIHEKINTNCGTNSTKLDVTNLETGIYFLKMQNTEYFKTLKFIKQ